MRPVSGDDKKEISFKTVPLPSDALNQSREMISEGKHGEALPIFFHEFISSLNVFIII
jgi:hypothetical protein